MKEICVMDSHTGGEPTRLCIAWLPHMAGAAVPWPGAGTAVEQQQAMMETDSFRRCLMNEPRGHDVLVGAMLTKPSREDCQFGLIFFNNVGYLGMCGHGTIGVVATLAYLGHLNPGEVKFESTVGVVTAQLWEDGLVSLENVESYVTKPAVTVDVPGLGPITGDIAWGGNWFFLMESTALGVTLELANVDALTDFSWRIRQALNAQGHPEVDHVEVFGPPQAGGDSRNFVLCPGKAYDRSPCGTGLSAKLACLAASGKLAPGTSWKQESIVGSVFEGRFEWVDETKQRIRPTIAGRAYVTASTTLLVDPQDPFHAGIC